MRLIVRLMSRLKVLELIQCGADRQGQHVDMFFALESWLTYEGSPKLLPRLRAEF